MKNKKVLVVCTTDNMVWQFLVPHIKFLEKLGNKVDVACNRSGFFFDELKEEYGLNVYEINFARNPLHPRNLKAEADLKALVKENKYDLIWCHQPVGGVMGRRVGKKFKIPVVYTAHGFHFFAGAPLINRLVYKTIEKHYAKYTDALVTMNEEDFENAKKFKAKRVYKINGIGIDLNKYKPEENFDRNEFRKSLGLNEEDFVIISVGELNENKNLITALKAINACENKNIKLISLGQGPLRGEFEEYVNKNNLQNRIQFLGFRKDVTKCLQSADSFVMPSFREGLPKSMMEAMALGLPVVASNIRGCRDLTIDGKGGILCDPSKMETFANAFDKLAGDKTLCEKMSRFNKQQIKQYDIEKVIEQMTKIFNQVKFK